MGLSQAMFSAISGLVNHQRAMDNIGNNLANVNTVAFKKGVFQFQTLLEQTLRGGSAADPNTGRGSINPLSLGLGTQTGSINKDFRQGPLEVTGNSRDMAIEGNGWFILRQGTGQVLTRDGTFYIGADGALLGNAGLQVQGVLAETGVIPTAGDVTDLTIPIGQTGAAVETTEAAFTGNLDSFQEIATGLRLANTPAAALPYTWSTDAVTSWNALAAAGTAINGGTVQTTADLAEGAGAAPTDNADLNTDLADLFYLDGTTWVKPFNGIVDGETISVSFRKGGRLTTSTFTYRDGASGVPSNTVEHLAEFLAGDVDDVQDVSSVNNAEAETLRLQGGIMGTIKVPPKISTTVAGGDSSYNVPFETGGAFRRVIHVGAYDWDAVPASGDEDSFNLSVVSNLGSENAITDIEFTYNNVRHDEIFAPDLDYSAVQGGSATTNLVAYDSLGNPKNVTIQMVLVDRDTNFSTWRWSADSYDDTDADWQVTGAPGAITTSSNVGTGVIRFDSEGRFVSGAELSESAGISITLEDQGVNNPIRITLQQGLSPTATQDLDFSDMTQVATDSDFNLKEQDGSPPGTLDSFTVTADGIIQGVFSNGVVQALGRISVALVPNENGLIAAGNNLFYEGPSSGNAQVAFANVGGRGEIRSGQIETSNVDLSEEFTRLVVTQRGFQANARVVTTSDEMLQELVNLKR